MPARGCRKNLALPFAPEAVEADPDGWLLHSATICPR